MIGEQSVHFQVDVSLSNVAMILPILKKWTCWSRKFTAKITKE